jgi:hypothetical protein
MLDGCCALLNSLGLTDQMTNLPDSGTAPEFNPVRIGSSGHLNQLNQLDLTSHNTPFDI